jgi:hypothetical protein
MKWITRERPKIDRIACPWLIKNFADKDAVFIYVPKEQVFEKAKELDAIPYDIPGAEYSHYGDECTFDFIIKKHRLTDPALLQLAVIVRVQTQTGLTWQCSQQDCGLFQQAFHTILKTIMKCWKQE